MKKLLLPVVLFLSVQASFSQSNVGVGTTTPTLGRLDVRGAESTTLLSLSTGSPAPGFSFFNVEGFPTMGFNMRYALSGYNRMSMGHSGMLQFIPSVGDLRYFSTQTTGIAGSPPVWIHRFSVDAQGNFGIGVSDPKARLHASTLLVGNNTAVPAAGYLLSIGGKMICEEARIQLRGNWPDYVFSKNYKLLSIGDVEKYIRLNHHLPNMPSAAEVEKEKGFDIGDMQKRLLEKVEELTLYVIQLKKENEQLQKRIEALEN